MLAFLILAPILFVALVLRRVRRQFRPYGRHYNPYGYSCGFGRHRLGRGLLTVLGLYALDRLFLNRRP